MKNKIFLGKPLFAVVAPIVAVLLIASLVTATIMLNGSSKTTVGGIIGRGDNGEAAEVISDAPFKYEIAARRAFILDFEKFLAVIFSNDFIQAVNSAGLSVAQESGNAVIDAFRRARVPVEKLLAFGDYLEVSANDIRMGFDPPENASVILALYGILSKDNGDDILAALLSSVDYAAFYKQIIAQTGLNPEEVGRVLYQLALAMSSGEDKQLIAELGEHSFVVLFSLSLVAGEEVTLLASGSTLASSRMVTELLFELGTEYRRIIDTFGIDNLNKLFGNVYIDEVLQQKDYTSDVIGAFEDSKELFGFCIAFFSEMLTTLDNKIADTYYSYTQATGGQKQELLAKTLLYAGAAAQKGLDYAYGASGLSAVEVGIKIASINAHLNLIGTGETDYNKALLDEIGQISRTFEALTNLAEAEQAAVQAGGYTQYLSNQANIDSVIGYADILTQYAPNIEKGLKMSLALVMFSYLSYIVVPNVS